MKMKHFLLIFSILAAGIFCQDSWAQKERNYIFLVDCSRSMNKDNYKLDNRALEYLEQRISEDATIPCHIVIVPFQGEAYSFEFRKDQFKAEWPAIQKKMNDLWYIDPEKATGTNICAAWDEGVKYIDPNKKNYFFLLTDGEDTKLGVNGVLERIRQWCSSHNEDIGLYVALHKDAVDSRIREAIQNCSSLDFVDPEKGFVPFGKFESTELYFNIQEKNHLTKSLSFSDLGKFELDIEDEDDNEFFEIESDGKVTGGTASFTLKLKQDIEAIPEDDVFRFEVSAKDDKKLNMPKQEITVHVKNVLENIVYLAKGEPEEINLGETAPYHHAFWFVEESPADTLHYNLQAEFNEGAKRHGSKVTLTVAARNESESGFDNSKFQLLVNGVPTKSREFEIDQTGTTELGFVLTPGLDEGDYYFDITAKSANLDRIGDVAVNDYSLSARISHPHEANWLEVLTWIIAGIFIAAAILWFVLLRPMLYPKFSRGFVVVSQKGGDYMTTIQLKGIRKIVFTSVRGRQSTLSALFTGGIRYEVNPLWTEEWSLSPGRGKGIRINTRGKYYVNPPMSSLPKRSECEVEAVSSNLKFTIQHN